MSLADIQSIENGAKFYRADLHIHSYGNMASYDVTDSDMTPINIIDEAIKENIAVITETKIDWVSPDDIGRFAAEAFAQPEKFNRKEFAITGDKHTLTEVADVLSSVVGKRFEAISQTEEEAANSGLFKYGIDSYLWQNVEGYKVDPTEIAEFGIQPESLKTYLERNKVQLQKIYSELK